jgi:hypothetical protein
MNAAMLAFAAIQVVPFQRMEFPVPENDGL